MTKEQYQSYSMAALRDMAKSRQMTKISALRKEQLIEVLMAYDAGQTVQKTPENAAALPKETRAGKTAKGTSSSSGRQGRSSGKAAEHAVKSAEEKNSAQRSAAERENKNEPLTADEIERRARQAAGRTERTGQQNARSYNSDSHDRRQNRTRRVQPRDQRNDGRAQRDVRDQREQREQREAREQRDSRGSRDSRDQRDIRSARDMQDQRDQRSSRDTQELRGQSDQGDLREMRDTRMSRDTRTLRRPAGRMNSADDSWSDTYAGTSDEEQRGDSYRDSRADGVPAGQNQNRSQSPDRPPMELSSLDSGNKVTGVLEVLADGYGFIRSDNYMPGEHDVYVAPSQIRKFSLRTGDIVSGNTRIRAQQEKFSALLYVNAVNGFPPSQAAERRNFEDMTPIFPNYRLRMEREGGDVSMRIVDLICPIGRGQRGMIVSQPKAGKTTLLKQIAHSILKNDPYMHIMIMLIDERPEEVTDIREDIVGERVEVLYSTFDEEPEHHIRVARMGIERAKRLVEYGEHVTILLDSITRLARASNLTEQPSGRTLSGGLDPAALNMPKKFFGAARNMREGGSLTILATALIDTGSKMDDVVYEEFKGTGNMELVLDRKLSERRVFPAINIPASSTRREDLLLSRDEQEAVFIMRRALSSMKTEEATENILNLFLRTRSNDDLVSRVRHQKFV